MNDLTAIGARPIRQPDSRSFVEAVRITFFIFSLATPFFAYMGLSAAQVKEEYRLSKLVEQRRQLTKEHERLLLTRDALLSPGVVSTTAREKLGMVEEDSAEWIVGVPPDKGGAGGQAGRGPAEQKETSRAPQEAAGAAKGARR